MFRARPRTIDMPISRLRLVDGLQDAVTGVARHPARTILTALGTTLGVATVVATVGLTGSASASVSGAFDALRATEVTFSDTKPPSEAGGITLASEHTIRQLNGVERAGVMWDVAGGKNLDVSPLPANADPGGLRVVPMPVTAATPAALATIRAAVDAGRLYDAGDERRQELVGLLGRAAAAQLGITGVEGSPAVFVNGTPITIIGIVGSAETENRALLGLIVPPGVSAAFGARDTRRLIVKTLPGAAQTIGAQGAPLLAPTDPARIDPIVPPDPRSLRQHVEGSLSGLLIALAGLSLAIGIVAIANTTLMSVMQRVDEIGLRRAVGARPVHIATLLVTEAVFVGTFGGVLGTSIGVLATDATAATRGWIAVLDPRLIFFAPLLGTLAGVLAGIYPARRATRITPVSALQHL
jgi:putative ABC transport system permease protein